MKSVVRNQKYPSKFISAGIKDNDIPTEVLRDQKNISEIPLMLLVFPFNHNDNIFLMIENTIENL